MRTLLCLLAVAAASAQETIPNFRLLDSAGESRELYRGAQAFDAVLLYVYSPECPDVRADIEWLDGIQQQYAGKLTVALLRPGAKHNAFAEAQMKQAGLTLLEDPFEWVTRSLGLQTTGVVLAEAKHWRVVYRGALSGLKTLDQLLASLDKDVQGAVEGPVSGCPLELAATPQSPDYAKDIAPILEARCVPCHRPGGVGPFALSSYAKVRGWSAMIREVLLTKRMPPWFADPHFGDFGNDRSLSRQELDKLMAWIDAGAPDSDGNDPLRGLAEEAAPEWPLGPPDLIVELPNEEHIPAQGVFDYRHVRVPSGLTEDKWVRAVDLQASNRAVTHHAVAFVEYPNDYPGERFDDEGGLNGYFALYVPGAEAMPFPPDTGKFVSAGANFVFSLHYTATGKPEVDRTRMGLYFCDQKPARELVTRAAANTGLAIRPGDANSETSAMHVLDRDVDLWGMSPHMHYRGKRMKYQVEYPDGRREVLLSVPDYHFDWQLMYQLREPKHLPAGSIIHVDGAFDNSAANPYNPDPADFVEFGNQSFEEMFIAYLNYSYDPAMPARVPEATGPALTGEELVDTRWLFGNYRVRFGAGGKLSIDDRIPGTWTIQGAVLSVAVGQDTYDFDLRGGQILSSQMTVRRLD